MTEELKNIENTDSVENTEVVENTKVVENAKVVEDVKLVEDVSDEGVEKSGNDKHWYVLRVMGGKEKKTVSLIEKEIDRLNMRDHVSKILVPTEKVYQIRNGKKISKERNFFSRICTC